MHLSTSFWGPTAQSFSLGFGHMLPVVGWQRASNTASLNLRFLLWKTDTWRSCGHCEVSLRGRAQALPFAGGKATGGWGEA